MHAAMIIVIPIPAECYISFRQTLSEDFAVFCVLAQQVVPHLTRLDLEEMLS